MRVTEIIGKPVYDANNEQLGTIDDIYTEPDSGIMMYLTLDAVNMNDITYDIIAIPWNAVHPAEGKGFRIGFAKDKLTQSPGVNRNDLASSVSDPTFNDELQAFFESSGSMGMGDYGSPKSMQDGKIGDGHISRFNKNTGEPRKRLLDNKRHL